MNMLIINTRIIFFDKLRYFLALSIIVFHASLAYSGHPWWPVSEVYESTAAQWTMVFLGAFTMPFFFFIAGYFAIPTIEKKGVQDFIKAKIIKLGIPWIICVLTVCPILPYIYHYIWGDMMFPMSYFDFWVMLHKNALNFDVGVIGSMKNLMDTNGFYLRYMWFLSLLLVFFIIFAIIYDNNKKRFTREMTFIKSEADSKGSAIKILIGTGLLTFFGSSLLLFLVKATVPGVTDMEPLFTLGNVLQFTVTGIFSYIVFFILGIVTNKKKWIEKGVFPGNFLTWILSFIIITIIYIYLYEKSLSFRVIFKDVPTQPIEIVVGLSLFFLKNLLAISAIGFFTYCAQRFSNSSTFISKHLSPVAYELYLGHYIFVLVLQLIFFTTPGIPVLIKFLIVSVGSVICAHVAALFLLKPRPRLSAALAFVMLIVMMLVIQ